MKKKKVIAWIMAAAMTFSPAVTYADLTVESQNAAPPSETVQTIADEETIYELGDTDEATTNEEPVYELGTPDADEEVVYELGDPDVQVADESTATVLSKNADSNSTGMAEVIMEDGSAATYSDVQSLVNTVASYSGKTFTIKLYSNISTADAGMFKIPSSSKVTLDLNGYSINRHKANASYDTDDDYEVVIVYENADLTIIDSDPKRYHGGYLDGSKGRKIWFENDGSTAMPIYGGVIAGGASENGAGGITIKNNATVTMKGGTIAGNVAGSGTFSYNGGGSVQLRNSGSKFILDGGRIMYNGAYKNNGGGIDNEEGVVELISGDVSYNWAYGGATNRHGGGIYINHEADRALYIHGSNTSEGNEEKRSVWVRGNQQQGQEKRRRHTSL